MADPLSITASIMAVLQAAEATVRYLRDVHDAPQERLDFLMEIFALESLLRPLQGRVREAISGDPWLTEIATLGVKDGPLDQLKSDLRRLESKLESRNWLREIGRRLTWRFTKTEIKDVLAKIERIKTLASFALENDLFSLSRSIEGKSLQIKDTVTKIEANLNEQKCRHILDWLSTLNFRKSQREVFQNTADGTGQWLLESTEFTNWRDGTSKTLWCPGIPGAGKTALTSIVVNHLQKFFKDEDDIVVACIYCNYKEQTQQTAANLVASLLKQILQNPGANFDDVVSLYELHTTESTHPTLDELVAAFKSTIRPYSKIFIVIDALDECREDNGTRTCLLRVLRSVAGSINMMVTSRHLPAIERDFQGTKRLEIRASDHDVRRYIEDRIASAPRRHLAALQDSIINKIIANVGGMFLLARLHMDSLFGKHTPAAVRRALEQLPKEVDDTYDEAMERIARQTEDDRELAKQVFSWITYSCRPLSVTELQHALAVIPGMTNMDPEGIIDQEILTSVCAGLVIIDEENNIIRLVHYTTQQYFERKREVLFPTAQLNITMTCLGYVSFDAFRRGYCHSDSELEFLLEDNPFLDYAARHWGNHAYGITDESYKNAVLKFLHNESNISCTSQVLLVDQGYKYPNYSQDFPRNFSGMHISSFFGLRQIVSCQLENGGKADLKDSDEQTPLFYAAGHGHEEVVKLLVAQDDVEVDLKDNDGRTPLSWAAARGHEEVVRLLAARDDVEMDAKDNDGSTPLSWASRYGHVEVVTQLVAWDDVNADSKDIDGRTPLSWAAEYGCNEVVRFLATRDDVETDSKDKYCSTPLSWAARYGRIGVIKQLVVCDDVEADSKDIDGRTPLSWAAEYGDEEAVRLLATLDSVETDSKDKDGSTPLSWASRYGRIEAVRQLVARDDVEADSKDIDGRTPLSWAAEYGCVDVVQLLMMRDEVEANLKDTDGRTPLSWAAGIGHEEVVRLLIARDDVEADSKDNYGRTPLWWAAIQGHQGVARLLVTHRGVGARLNDDEGRRPLRSEAAEYGY